MRSLLGLLFMWPVGCLAVPAPTDDAECRCVPDQWEGQLSTFDREFDLHGGRSAASDSLLRVHYDYTNQLFAMEDMQRGSVALADYKQELVVNASLKTKSRAF
ncbi:hypothetical protein CAPTEDRAFT_192952 [Capitella teleta]|uniref:Uncharacterized protein n=1 Tax=Capitella teleta TaxID=283909 RepID=R7TS86_CAPTE|nr:hypothetical protein CAPTEDRAFT_192952 [Capitella teleta]|eukprot:ELT94331.1 hypothetical protein CAPTEDRAFT_192952 [Capitella teleta]